MLLIHSLVMCIPCLYVVFNPFGEKGLITMGGGDPEAETDIEVS